MVILYLLREDGYWSYWDNFIAHADVKSLCSTLETNITLYVDSHLSIIPNKGKTAQETSLQQNSRRAGSPRVLQREECDLRVLCPLKCKIKGWICSNRHSPGIICLHELVLKISKDSFSQPEYLMEKGQISKEVVSVGH